MRHGFLAMTLKPNNSPHAGRVLLFLIPKSTTGVFVSDGSAACYFFFVIRGIMHYEFLHEGQAIKIFISGGSEMSVGGSTKKGT
jgi:hypothetical protein